MRFLVPIMIILFLFTFGWAEADKKDRDSLAVVPGPEKAPEARDSIVVINYVVFYSRLEVILPEQGKTMTPATPALVINFKVHVENHSEGTLKGFEIKYLTLYDEKTNSAVGSYKLEGVKEKLPVDMKIHTLKDIEFKLTPLKIELEKLSPGNRVYGRFLARYNKEDHFISTKPVEVKVNSSADIQKEKTN